MTYVFAFLLTFILTLLVTPVVRRFADRKGILDRPEADSGRKVHHEPTPLLGGLVPLASFTVGAIVFSLASELIFTSFLSVRQFVGMLIAGLILGLGGYLDDRFSLRPGQQLLAPILASLVAIASGFGIDFITNPLGGVIPLDRFTIELFRFGGVPYHLTLFADLFTFLWLMILMFTTKLLDGLDGLASGISVIGSLILFALSLSKGVAQPGTALLAMLFAGAMAGFLLFNWHPAKIFLGQAGSLWVGFMLGLLAVVSGGKIATALLIMGVPILDLLWVAFRRLLSGRPVAEADRKHLHFRLLDVGLSHRQAVLLLYVVTAGFGVLGLFSKTQGKLWLLVSLFAFMVFLGFLVVGRYQRKQKGVSV